MAFTAKSWQDYPGSTTTPITAAALIDLETRLSAYAEGPTTLVTALPGSPVDGQEVFFQSTAMATDGIVWHLKYRSGSSSSYKWEFVGGEALWAEYDGSEAPSTTYGLSNGPSLTIPLQGDYELEYGCFASSTVANFMYMSFDSTNILSGAVAAVDADAAIYVTTVANAFGNGSAIARIRRKAGLTSGSTVLTRYKCPNAGGSVASRWLRIRPMRVI